MNKQTGIILAVVAVAVDIVEIIGAYAFLNTALVPLELRKETATAAALQNVKIQTTTFN